MKLPDLIFVVPSLFTLSSIACGFYAMTLCAADGLPLHLYQASIAIFFAFFFDGFDGRVARLTRTQSLFGQELDSLADIVTFGAAPALLVWRWALEPLGFAGLAAAFAYLACGSLRLARFNVLAIRSPTGGSSRFFVGMPIPFAAAGIISLIIAFQNTKGGQLPDAYRWPVFAGVLFLGLLMVSSVRYRTFKHLRPSSTAAVILATIFVTGVFIATRVHPAWVLVAFFGLYLVSGFVESTVMLLAYVQRRGARTSGALSPEESDEDDGADTPDDQEYL